MFYVFELLCGLVTSPRYGRLVVVGPHGSVWAEEDEVCLVAVFVAVLVEAESTTVPEDFAGLEAEVSRHLIFIGELTGEDDATSEVREFPDALCSWI